MDKKNQVVFTISILLLLLSNICFSQNASLKDEMRMPHSEKTGGFITDWLVIGGFKVSEGNAFETDFLKEHGSENNIVPTEGMIHTQANGSEHTWGKYESPYNYVNFFNALDGQNFTSSTAYYGLYRMMILLLQELKQLIP